MPMIRFLSLIFLFLASFAFAETFQHQEILMTFMTKHISVSINRPAAHVYAFTSNPENLSRAWWSRRPPAS
jgi:hypothetical protein